MTDPADSDVKPAPTPAEETAATRPRPRLSKWMVVVIGCMVILFLVMFFQKRTIQDGTSHPAVGQTMSTVNLLPLTPSASGLTQDDLADKVTLMNFWGTWCPPCQLEMPHLVELQHKLKGEEKFQFVSVSCPANEPADLQQLTEDTNKYLKSLEADFPAYADPTISTRLELMDTAKLEAFSYPTTVLLDGEGKILALWVGYQPGLEKRIQRTVDQALAGSRGSP